MKLENIDQRKALRSAKRIVIKLGSRLLIDKAGKPEMKRIGTLVAEISRLYKEKKRSCLCLPAQLPWGSIHWG